ncbi:MULTISPECIES: hypothetical protein [unclassified Candidatus Cardinium]|uniref:hypothetical protein n=1 Tax=unclassified Candidatus Cardinium TaxID=2641185 RepID=UPI001FB47742|nr:MULTISPECIES: hypothetical protein [unclassified Candidatus Cardinium]
MKKITVDYKHFNKAGFDGKTCSISDYMPPMPRPSTTTAMVYDTSSKAPVFQNQGSAQEAVNFVVEFLPFITGKHLLTKAYNLVQEVLEDKYHAEPCTICIYKKDGSIDTKITVNDVFVQKAELFLNRKNEAAGEMGYIRIRFTLEGLQPTPR